MTSPEISVVIPVYGAEKIVKELLKRLHHSLSQITNEYEIILVDDRSPDQGWIKMVEGAREDNRVKLIRLSRNFGQHYALSAGIQKS